MRASVPTVHCDGDDGWCTDWSVDYYEQGASAVDGVRVSENERAPEWVSDEVSDYCPDCAKGETDDQ